MAGRYEVRESHSRVPGVLAVVWVGDELPASIVFTIAAERLPLLADALNRYLADNPDPGAR